MPRRSSTSCSPRCRTRRDARRRGRSSWAADPAPACRSSRAAGAASCTPGTPRRRTARTRRPWRPRHGPRRGRACRSRSPPADVDVVWAPRVLRRAATWPGRTRSPRPTALLRPGGLLVAVHAGPAPGRGRRRPSRGTRQHTGLLVLGLDRPAAQRWAVVFTSAWWRQEHWGRGFDAVLVRPAGVGHGASRPGPRALGSGSAATARRSPPRRSPPSSRATCARGARVAGSSHARTPRRSQARPPRDALTEVERRAALERPDAVDGHPRVRDPLAASPLSLRRSSGCATSSPAARRRRCARWALGFARPAMARRDAGGPGRSPVPRRGAARRDAGGPGQVASRVAEQLAVTPQFPPRSSRSSSRAAWMYSWQLGQRRAPVLHPVLDSIHATRAGADRGTGARGAGGGGAGRRARSTSPAARAGSPIALVDWGAGEVLGVDIREQSVRRARLVSDHLGYDARPALVPRPPTSLAHGGGARAASTSCCASG